VAANARRISSAACRGKFADPVLMVRTMCASWSASSAATDWTLYRAQPQLSLIEAKRRLRQTLEEAVLVDAAKLTQARDAFLAAADHSIVQGFEALLEQTADPFEKLALLDIADYAREHIASHYLVEDANASLRGYKTVRRGPLPIAYIDDRIKRHREFLRLRREWQK
jgi:hypothetical protein